MSHHVLTGAPGAGKTALLQALRDDYGYAVVPEAATDVIAAAHARGIPEPERSAGLVADIAALQRERRLVVAGDQRTVLFDRSAVCTLALARYLGHPVPEVLTSELAEATYDHRVFVVRPLGFVVPTAARRIGYAESLAFETVHVQVYGELGYTLVDVPATTVEERAALVDRLIRSWS